jgi:hypothetical protein
MHGPADERERVLLKTRLPLTDWKLLQVERASSCSPVPRRCCAARPAQVRPRRRPSEQTLRRLRHSAARCEPAAPLGPALALRQRVRVLVRSRGMLLCWPVARSAVGPPPLARRLLLQLAPSALHALQRAALAPPHAPCPRAVCIGRRSAERAQKARRRRPPPEGRPRDAPRASDAAAKADRGALSRDRHGTRPERRQGALGGTGADGGRGARGADGAGCDGTAAGAEMLLRRRATP